MPTTKPTNKPTKKSKPAQPAPPPSPAPVTAPPGVQVTVSKGLLLVNAPARYAKMARFQKRPPDAVDAIDTIHLFVDDVPELQKLLPVAFAHRGVKTALVVIFRHHDRMTPSRDAIKAEMERHAYASVSAISMGDSEWGATRFVQRR